MNTSENIENLLRASFQVHFLDVIDESHKHAGHAEAQKRGGGHFRVILVSPDFSGKSLIERHRMVHKALKPIAQDIHALTLNPDVP